MLKVLCFAVLLAASPAVFAQQLELPATVLSGDTARATAMPRLAEQVIAIYRESDRDKYLNTLFRLQLVAGRHADAITSIHALRELRRDADPTAAAATFVQYEAYVKARLLQDHDHQPFADAFAQSFRGVFATLDDKAALQAAWSFGGDLAAWRVDLQKGLEQHQGQRSIALADALALIRKYQVHEVYSAILPFSAALLAQDEQRRYIIDDDVLVKTPDGASIATMVVRPRSTASTPLPALFEFTIYANDEQYLADAKKMAAHGYVGVVGYTRGKGRSPDAVVPYEHDGDDARAVIDWIAQQPWSDGRVGMYASSYNGYTQWAAAKRHPAALKAIATSATVAPGIDVPMQGNIFMSFTYPWLPYVTNHKTLDEATYGDSARWEGLNKRWYASGQAYRALDRIDGTPNPFFRRWLEHPGYDAYWQVMIPYREEFAGIDIPVLATVGYFDGGQGVTYYFNEHHRYHPRADHTLVAGPYGHVVMQAGPARVEQGYEIDPVAHVDLQALRLQWFDYIFKGGAKPALLKDKVNYQVMGGNEWKHASSLQAMGNTRLRFHLVPMHSGAAHRLSVESPKAGAFIAQTVNFADRSDVDWTAPAMGINKTLDTHNGLAFVSDPIVQPTEVSGLFAGQLDFVVNKRDMDVALALYEQLPSGDYFQLSTHQVRASYASDRSQRKLLTPGQRQQLAFRSERLTSRKLQPGSRLVVVLGINKQADVQINYGTGKDVSDETIADAKVPLRVKWYGASYIDIPVWR